MSVFVEGQMFKDLRNGIVAAVMGLGMMAGQLQPRRSCRALFKTRRCRPRLKKRLLSSITGGLSSCTTTGVLSSSIITAGLLSSIIIAAARCAGGAMDVAFAAGAEA